MNDREYANWIIKDTWSQLRPVLIGYALVLALYWTVIG